MLSIWERNEFIHYHHVIIGSGIVGLCTAYYIKLKYPAQSVLVMERGLIPSGASTKNAGFACMGSLTELLDDLQSSTEDEMLQLFLLRKKGLERLQQLLGKEKIGYNANGSYELLFEKDVEALDQLETLNGILFKELNVQAFKQCNEKMDAFGFEKQQVKALIENTFEGEIDTGLMMKHLLALVQSMGVHVKTGCEVLSINDEQQHVSIVCKNPVADTPFIFKGNRLLICNNAFATNLLPDLDVKPGRGQVLITKPIEGLKFKGIFHFDKGYYYFREYNGCVLFGGGRHLDKETETTTDLSLNESIQQHLIEQLQTIILPHQTVEIDLQWSGIMAFGMSKKPIVQPYTNNIFIGVRMGGMGVAIGSEVAFQLSDMV